MASCLSMGIVSCEKIPDISTKTVAWPGREPVQRSAVTFAYRLKLSVTSQEGHRDE